MQVKGPYSVYGCLNTTIQSLWLSEHDFLDQMLSIDYNRTSNDFVDVNVTTKNHGFNIPLSLETYNIMIVMQKLKFIQEFTMSINVECLPSSLQAKLIMHNCARAKNSKTCFCSI